VSATPGEDDSHAGRRTVSIDPLTVHELKAHKARQAAERLVIESDWPDSDPGLPNGVRCALFPDTPSQLLPKLIAQYNEKHAEDPLPRSMTTPSRACAELVGLFRLADMPDGRARARPHRVRPHYPDQAVPVRVPAIGNRVFARLTSLCVQEPVCKFRGSLPL
jgi:hypothetical protein